MTPFPGWDLGLQTGAGTEQQTSILALCFLIGMTQQFQASAALTAMTRWTVPFSRVSPGSLLSLNLSCNHRDAKRTGKAPTISTDFRKSLGTKRAGLSPLPLRLDLSTLGDVSTHQGELV